MAEMLAEVFVASSGAWRNLREMEENLTLDELYLLKEAKQLNEWENFKRAAALKGISLDDEEEETSTWEDVERRAQAALAGVSEEEFTFGIIGIEIDEDDED